MVGISGDTVESHRKFAENHRLSFTLLADPDGTAADAYGVRMKLLGRVIAKRVTFLIDTDGTVARVWDPAPTTKQAEVALAGARELGLTRDAEAVSPPDDKR